MIMTLAAATVCLITPLMHDQLRTDYEEAPVAVVIDGAAVLELWAAPTRQSWTLVRSTADGKSCIVGAGYGVLLFEPVAPGDPA